MRWAIVTNGLVTNLVLWDGVTPWHESTNAVAVGDQPVDIGWAWNGTTFVEPEE
jgi:hypothetical protein